MNEFVEKLIDRLEEERKKQQYLFNNVLNNEYQRMVHAYAEQCYLYIADIVNQLAEEYNGGWILCSERLPEENGYDDGYVEPSDCVLVFTKYGSYKTSRYWGNRRNQRDYYDWVDIKYRKDEVIAWKPITPYQPKGE